MLKVASRETIGPENVVTHGGTCERHGIRGIDPQVPLAQRNERSLDMGEAAGSIPARNTKETTMEVKQVLVVRKDLNMRKGKMVSQGGHAAMKFLLEANESTKPDELLVKLSPAEIQWLMSGHTKITCGCDSEDELKQLILAAKLKNIEVHEIIDAGRTEFNGVPTLTCAAFGPCDAEVLDEVTGNLKLL